MERRKPPEKLYSEQHDIYNALQDFFLSDQKTGYVCVPTGAGKTVVLAHMLHQLHEQQPDYRSAIVTSRQNLLDQTRQTMEDQAGFAPEDIGVILDKYRGEKRDEMLKRNNIILTYPMLLQLVKAGKLDPEEIDVFIFDEAHHTLGKKTKEFVQRVKRSQSRIVGFTATPHYSQDKTLGELLENEIFKMGIPEALEKDLICSFSVLLAETQVDLRGVTVDSRGEYNEAQLQKAINITERNLGAVELYKKAFLGKKSIVYCAGIAHAEKVSKMFAEAGVSAAFISCKTSKKERKRILDDHRSGMLTVLCNADLLIEGYDDPEISVGINLRPTLSMLLAEQRGGRVIRRDPKNPQKHAYIVDFVDTEDRKQASVTYAQIVENAGALAGYKRGSNGKYSDVQERELRIKENDVIVQVNGLRVIVNAEEVMRHVRERLEHVFEQALHDEYTLNALVGILGLPASRINTMITSAQLSGNLKRDNKGSIRMHYSGSQLEQLKEMKKELPFPPSRWMSARDIAKIIGLEKPGSVSEMMGRMITAHPEFKKLIRHDCLGPHGMLTTYFDPSILVHLPRQNILPLQAPNTYSLTQIGTGAYDKDWHPKLKSLRKWLKGQREVHPEWFSRARHNISNIEIECIAGEAVQAYRDSLKGYVGADMVQINALADDLKISRETVQKWAVELGGEGTMRREISPQNSQAAQFISTELAQQIRSHKEGLLPKANEVQVRHIAKDLGVSVAAIQKRLSEMGVHSVHERWDEQLHQLVLYVGPELETIIRNIAFVKRSKRSPHKGKENHL